MTSRLNPYINFSGNARQAMGYYHEIFGGQLALNTYGQSGAEGTPFADQIMHGMLDTDSGFTLMGADAPPGTELTFGNNMSVSLSGDDSDDLRRYWERLSDGGMVQVPLERQMWGDVFGMCTDRFGISWLVNIAEPQA
jgi:PhnB protein